MTLYYKMRQTLLQNATAILLQNATKVYYKMRQVFYYKMRPLLQNAMFTTNCDSTYGKKIVKKGLNVDGFRRFYHHTLFVIGLPSYLFLYKFKKSRKHYTIRNNI